MQYDCPPSLKEKIAFLHQRKKKKGQSIKRIGEESVGGNDLLAQSTEYRTPFSSCGGEKK